MPEDACSRSLLACWYAEDSKREATMATTLRPNESSILCNAACTSCSLNMRAEAMDELAKAWRAGYKEADWIRGDPDLVLLCDEPEFERLYLKKSDKS